MAGGRIAIHVEDLVVGFSDHVVIDGLSLDVREGEILGLVGASGGGKSVLLRTLIELLPKRSGRIGFPAFANGKVASRPAILWSTGTPIQPISRRIIPCRALAICS